MSKTTSKSSVSKANYINETDEELQQFYGTEGYHSFSRLYRNAYLTDGVQFLCCKYGCYWLMDLICSYGMYLPRDSLSVVVLNKSKSSSGCTVGIFYDYSEEDKEFCKSNKIKSQRIDYTDFPSDLKLYVHVRKEDTRDIVVIMLPTEY